MYSTIYLFGILLAGFAIYTLVRDHLFGSLDMEPFQPIVSSIPAPAPVLIRQAPIYPERTASGQSQDSSDEVVVYGPPQANDPYNESQENSTIPENMRQPERAYRPSPSQHNTSIAVQSGIASETSSGSTGNMMDTEMIHNGGEFMSGVFANDTFDASTFSSF